MADYTPISDSQVDPDAPITSELGYAFRDNPIAITEGAPGAPRIQDAALSGAVTAAGRNWVADRSSAPALGALGTYAMAAKTTAGIASPGTIVPGADLSYASAEGATSAALSGNWRCQGFSQGGGSAEGGSVTLWVRVS